MQFMQAVSPRQGGVIALHRRRRRGQQQQRAVPGTAEFGHVPGVIPRGGFRFIGVLLLLVHDNQAEVVAGGEHGRAGADHHAGFPPLDPLPLVHSLPDGQRAVKHRHAPPVFFQKQAHHLGRQADFRHQNQYLAAVLQHLVDEIHIHLGFATAGDAVQQRAGRLTLAVPAEQRVIRRLLLSAQDGGDDGRQLFRLLVGRTEHLVFVILHHALFDQRGHHRRGYRREIAQLLDRRAPHVPQQPNHRLLLIGADAQRLVQRLPLQGQARHADGGVPHLAESVLRPLHGPPFEQAEQAWRVRVQPQLFEQRLLFHTGGRAFGQKGDDLPLFGRHLFQPVFRLRRQAQHGPQPHVQPGGQHGAHRVEHRTEGPLLKP